MRIKETKYERRLTNPTAEHLATRAVTDNNGQNFIEGYAILFNTPSRVIVERGRVFKEVIQPTAFDRVLSGNPNVIMNINHDDNKPLARTKNGSLQLSKDENGVKYRFAVPNTQLGKDTLELVKSRFYSESSFRYTINESGEEWKRDGNDLIHVVREATNLFDCSIVTDGAFQTNGISVSNRVSKRALDILSGTTANEDQQPVIVLVESDDDEEKDAAEPTATAPDEEPDEDDYLEVATMELELIKLKIC